MSFVDAFNQAGVFAKLSLLVGFGPPLLAIVYIVQRTESTLAILRPVSLASIFAGISGLIAGLIAVLTGLAAMDPEPVLVSAVYAGLAEGLVAPFVNFGLLAVAWLLVAVAMLRRPRLD